MAEHQLTVYKTLGSIPSTELMEFSDSLRSLSSHHLTNQQTARKKKTLEVTDYTHQPHSLAKALSAHWVLFKSEPHFSSMILYLALLWHHDKIKTSPDDRRSLFVEVSTHINVINLAAREDKIAYRQDSFSLL